MRDYGIGAQILADLGLADDPAAHEQPEEDPGIEGYGLDSRRAGADRDDARRRRTRGISRRNVTSSATSFTIRT